MEVDQNAFPSQTILTLNSKNLTKFEGIFPKSIFLQNLRIQIYKRIFLSVFKYIFFNDLLFEARNYSPWYF